jgi:hypothetical protein
MKFPDISLIRDFKFPVLIRIREWSDGWTVALDAAFIEIECKSDSRKSEFTLYFSLLTGNLGQSRVRARLRPPPSSLQPFLLSLGAVAEGAWTAECAVVRALHTN